MENSFIEEDFSIDDIHIYTNIFNEFHNVFPWTFVENPKIDSLMVEKKTIKYPKVKLVSQKD